ncbi:MAG: DUF5615 family PIN-like protein [Gammaproteobacteria bacterium]
MARLLADENFPLPVVEALRQLGHDAVTLAEIGKAGLALTDDAVLAIAAEDERSLLTINRRHFIRLHLAQADHAGIIACTFDADFASQAQRIHAAIVEQSLLVGQLIRVNRPNI